MNKNDISVANVEELLEEMQGEREIEQRRMSQSSKKDSEVEAKVAPTRLQLAFRRLIENKQKEEIYEKDQYFNRVLQEAKKDYQEQRTFNNDKGAIRNLATVRLGLKIKRQQGDISKEIDRFKLEGRADHNRLYGFCFKIALSKHFTTFISLCIVANTIVLALDRHPISLHESDILDKTNLGLSSIFLVEMIVKLLGLGVKAYFKDSFNILDCIIVVSNIVDIFVHAFNGTESGSSITALRGFRLIRVFKLAKTWKKFGNLLKTIATTMVDISTFSVLLFLFMFSYSLLGMELFAYENIEMTKLVIEQTGEVSERANFNNFLHAFTTVFIVLCND